MQDRVAGDRDRYIKPPVLIQAAKPGRRYAYDFEGMPIQAHGLADHAAFAAEITLPEAVADHRQSWCAAPVFVASKNAALDGRHAQHAEEISDRKSTRLNSSHLGIS